MLHSKSFEEKHLSASVRAVMNHQVGICSWSCPVVNLERVSEVSAVFLLLHPDVTGAEFDSGYLSVMNEHYYLPGEMETRCQSHPRTALGSWPISQICTMASKNNIFYLSCFSSNSRGNNLSPTLILLCFTPPLLFPGHNWTWN